LSLYQLEHYVAMIFQLLLVKHVLYSPLFALAPWGPVDLKVRNPTPAG
jgi:hypothetical protein